MRARIDRSAAAVLAAALLMLTACGAPPASPKPSRASFDDLTYSEFAGSHLALRVRAYQALVAPQRLGALQISALSELVLTRAKVEIFERSELAAPVRETAAPPPTASLGRIRIPGLLGDRRVAGATLYGFDCTVVRDGTPRLRLEAAQASTDLRTGDVVLRDARVEHLPSARLLSAHRAIWRPGANEVVIRGEYLLTSRGTTVRGTGGRFGVRLVDEGTSVGASNAPRNVDPARR